MKQVILWILNLTKEHQEKQDLGKVRLDKNHELELASWITSGTPIPATVRKREEKEEVKKEATI
jgi:hypothetical protein